MSGTNSRRGKVALFSLVGAAALLSSACNEGGLPNKNRPFEEAAHKEWRYLPYEKSPEFSKPMQVAGHTWQMSGATEVIPANMLQPVADVNGKQIFSLKSDAAPYNVLYAAGADGRYSVVSQID